MTTQLRRIPMWIRALAAGVLVAAAVATGLAFAGSAGASSSPPATKVLRGAPSDSAKGPICARPGAPGKGTGTGTHATPLSPAKGERMDDGLRGVPKTLPGCVPGHGTPAPARVK